MQHDQHLYDACSAMADGNLTSAEAAELQREMARHDGLRAEYETVRAVRSLLRERSDRLRMPVPSDIEASVRAALHRERVQSTLPGRAQPSVIDGFVDRIIDYLRRPVVAVGVATAVLVGVVWVAVDRLDTPGAAVAEAPFNLYEATYANYQDIVGGTLELSLQTTDPAALADFFTAQGVPYTVFFPTFTPEMNTSLVGGVVSEHNGQRYAHLVYRTGEHLIYIFEVDEASIHDQRIAMHATVAEDLEQSTWHWEERAGIGTMFVWESNNVVCSAVSDLATQDFSALFNLETL